MNYFFNSQHIFSVSEFILHLFRFLPLSLSFSAFILLSASFLHFQNLFTIFCIFRCLCTSSGLHLLFNCTLLHFIHSSHFILKTIAYIFICTSLTLLHNSLAASEYNCAYISSRAVLKQVDLFCRINVTSEIECANNLLFSQSIPLSPFVLFMFVMPSPASIIYADLSTMAEVAIMLQCDSVVCQQMLIVTGSVARGE